nr:NADH dehydrogenase subunit 6 [Peloridium hammoniorum]
MIKIVILSFNMLLTSLFLFITHPMMMGLILILQTFLISLMTSIIYKSNWITFIIFITLLGGMLMLFTYIISLANNEKITNPKISWLLIIFLIILLFIIILNNWYVINHLTETLNNFLINQSKIKESLMLAKLFDPKMKMMSILAMLFLFTNLSIIQSILTINKGPLRKMQ